MAAEVDLIVTDCAGFEFLKMVKIPRELLSLESSACAGSEHLKWSLRRPIVRMPAPFCSISESLSNQRNPVPRFLNTNKASSANVKEGKEERILISEVRAYYHHWRGTGVKLLCMACSHPS